MTEITHFGAVVLVVSGGLVLGILSNRLGDRIPVPAPAVFLLGAAVASDLWPSLYDAVPIRTVERIAVVALVVILFDGGMGIGWSRFRQAAWPILSLGILGTFATAGIVTLVAHWVLGFDWTLAGLVGAALAPTDPAVMFSVLRGSDIEGRSGTTLEGEAGVNDPAGIALMVGMIELATHGDASFLVVVREFAVEMGVGAAMGLAGAAVAVPLLRRVHLPERALYPVFALLLAASLYGATSLARGSGFLAVFVTGLVLGEGRFPAAREIQGFHTSLATLAEVVVFGALGLTVRIGELDARIWLEGLVLALALAIFIRPVVVAVVLARARLSRGERTFIAWTGLKGAVPILLAAFAILGGASGAEHVYGVVFVVVLVSVVGQGTCVPFVARRLRIPMSPVAHRA